MYKFSNVVDSFSQCRGKLPNKGILAMYAKLKQALCKGHPTDYLGKRLSLASHHMSTNKKRYSEDRGYYYSSM